MTLRNNFLYIFKTKCELSGTHVFSQINLYISHKSINIYTFIKYRIVADYPGYNPALNSSKMRYLNILSHFFLILRKWYQYLEGGCTPDASNWPLALLCMLQGSEGKKLAMTSLWPSYSEGWSVANYAAKFFSFYKAGETMLSFVPEGTKVATPSEEAWSRQRDGLRSWDPLRPETGNSQNDSFSLAWETTCRQVPLRHELALVFWVQRLKYVTGADKSSK